MIRIQRDVKPIVARRQTEQGSGLGRHRSVVERIFAWLPQPPLLVRTDSRDDIREGFLPSPAGDDSRRRSVRTLTTLFVPGFVPE